MREAETLVNSYFSTFTDRIMKTTLPDKFKPMGIDKYNGKQDPIQWL